MTLATPGLGDRVVAPEDESEFDAWHPAHISPLVAWLCKEDCPATAQVYWVGGNRVARYLEWTRQDVASNDGPWTFEALDEVVGGWETNWVESRNLKVVETTVQPRREG